MSVRECVHRPLEKMGKGKGRRGQGFPTTCCRTMFPAADVEDLTEMAEIVFLHWEELLSAGQSQSSMREPLRTYWASETLRWFWKWTTRDATCGGAQPFVPE